MVAPDRSEPRRTLWARRLTWTTVMPIHLHVSLVELEKARARDSTAPAATAVEHRASKLGYRPPLDGMRGVAVALVVLVHNPKTYPGGRLGVDIFFVLSGFLITALLLEEHDTNGAVLFRNFYLRRAARLAPALCVALGLVAFFVSQTSNGAVSLAPVVPAVIFYYANWYAVIGHRSLGYFSHAWSLAIEEQFYMVWPALLVAFHRKQWLARGLPMTIVVIAVARLLAAALMTGAWLDNWTIFRADELLVGAYVAYGIRGGRIVKWRLIRTSTAPCLAALFLVGTSLVVPRRDWLLLAGGYLAVAACVGVVLAHVVAVPGGPTARALSIRPLVALGRVSYGVYLFHFPIFIYVQSRQWSTVATYIAQYAFTATIVVLSWRFVEKPFLRLKDRLSWRPATPV